MAWWREHRERFEITERFAFFNHAGVAPLCPPAAEAMREYVARSARQAYVGSEFYPRCSRARESAARLINAESPETIAFVANTTAGIAQVAEGLGLPAGANVVTTAIEFPANIYPWMALQADGVELRMVGGVEQDGVLRVPTEDLLAAADAHTAVIALSAVQYATGQAHDLPAIGRFARDRGILFCVDAIQQLGARPLDVQACRIDFLSADGHKWLLGPEGAAIFYCRAELIERLRPLVTGWKSMNEAWIYEDYRFELLGDSRRFEPGSLNVPGVWGLGAAIDLFNDIGMQRVWDRIESLTDRLVAGLTSIGCRVASPRGPDEKSGIVSFAPASGSADPDVVSRLAREHGLIIVSRAGRYRASPHFYNSEEEIDRLIEAVDSR